MSICTITQFQMALRNPDVYLNTLKSITADFESFCCTKHFAECRAIFNGASVMVYAPITQQAMCYANRAIGVLNDIDSDIVVPRVMPDEITFYGLNARYCSLLIEPITMGMPLSSALHLTTRAHLNFGLNELKRRMRYYDISHNNLHVNNIIVDSEYRWHPMRCYYITKGYGEDKDRFSHIAKLISHYGIMDDIMSVEEELSPYTTSKSQKREEYPLLEQRRRFTTKRGTGFKDHNGNIVIEDIFAAASDFEEGRATVTTHNGKMGLINRRGDMVIPAEYDVVEFSVETGASWVAKDGLWTRFDYNGQQLEEWHSRKQ